MREILFRGKTVSEPKWVEGFYFREAGSFIKELPSAVATPTHLVHPETIGQYTGLTDKNGTKIFEGDIVRYAYTTDYDMYLESLERPEDYEGVDFSDLWTVDTVAYGIELGYPAFDLSNHEWDCNGLSELNESCLYIYEVIGNIHDNPELLSGNTDVLS